MDLFTAQELATRLMREWECDGWNFRWSNGKRQLGCATHKRNRITGEISNREIRLSRHLVTHNDVDEVQDVILHEIAHVKAGLDNGHNHVWRSWARKVGARPERLADTSRVNTVEPKYLVVCTGCDVLIRKAHRRIKLDGRYCRSCGVTAYRSGSAKLQMQMNPKRGQVVDRDDNSH